MTFLTLQATNLLGTLLKMNCVNRKRVQSKRFGRDFMTGVLPQVSCGTLNCCLVWIIVSYIFEMLLLYLKAPWGKHNPGTLWDLILPRI